MIPKTTTQFKNVLFDIIDHYKTGYWNEYPYNLGYYHNSGIFTFDCVNLTKAVLNGWEPIKQVGYFCDEFKRTGDCDELQLINQCRNISGDFSKLKDVSVLYMPGHIGNFVGEFERNGKKYNVIECTSNDFASGVIPSYVDSFGYRFTHKNGMLLGGSWKKHGTMEKWLTYDQKEPFDYEKAIRISMKIEKGDYGNNPERRETITKKYGAEYYESAQGMINYLHTYF